jgi:hypothetical protein
MVNDLQMKDFANTWLSHQSSYLRSGTPTPGVPLVTRSVERRPPTPLNAGRPFGRAPARGVGN